ncbi:hypothetical protein GCM10010124_13950 [Pilimelia terevasa]|uniref:Uncharacterized protein n=1 Tax=Pilimelia terevasa TaxID=53372 RepID=A0A8J3FHV1_9ACTN|nr:hypothetical protein [Pilimelia terevasa]GGK22637.1 hypothetical protein GCM10010124_13950 [Pilimelia terevasa]
MSGTDFEAARVALVVAGARRAVQVLAPDEAEVFDEVVDRWRSPARRRVVAPGRAVGFGIDALLVGEIALQALSAGFAEVLAVGTVAGGRRWWRRRRTGAAPPPPEDGADGSTPPEDPDRQLSTLSPAVLARLREATARHAVTLGLPPDRAALLADAAVGALHCGPE